MPTVYGYARVSKDETDREADNLSIETQKDRMRKYFDYRFEGQDVEFGGVFVDENVSGSEKIWERPAGREMYLRINPGDHIIFSKLDRGFRNLLDLCTVTEEMQAREIHVHFLDLNADTSTPNGRFFIHIIGAVKQLEWENVSERIKEVLGYKKERGLPHNHAPLGWHVVGKKETSKFAPDREERRICQRIVALHDDEKMAFWAIFQLFREKSNPVLTRKGREWSHGRIKNGYQVAKKGFPLPNGKLEPSG